MRKLKLDLEELAVESFETEALREARGTVEGHEQYTYYCNSIECTANGASCVWSRCNTCESGCETLGITCP
ncbi:MAG TPA: pinensin family lanthipeptide [Longimicrobium sp.]|nr:pinensin family lanthipeptide [Longimicrobium sp.]